MGEIALFPQHPFMGNTENTQVPSGHFAAIRIEVKKAKVKCQTCLYISFHQAMEIASFISTKDANIPKIPLNIHPKILKNYQ